ncbi:hypothetical protein L1049_012141 [Liquidambar formosana]|uniref:FAR1 domain-containing protein n=1 Tax=Liquidambar formosana TaxID=63359 RepID=A0AAP0X0B9_LIQFO
MAFNSEDEVCTFYSNFAKSQGFGIKKVSVKSDADGRQKYFSLAYSRNDKHVPTGTNILNPRPSIRMSCKAKINVIVRSRTNFVITKVLLPYNHNLSPSKSRYQLSHRSIDSIMKRMLKLNDQVGIPFPKSYNAQIIKHGDYDQVSFMEKDTRNFITKARDTRLGGGDAEVVYQYFKRM